MRISDILRRKGSEVVTVSPDRDVLEAVRVLVEHNIGAVVVVAEERPAGILSERDVLRLAARTTDLSAMTVGEAMTTDLAVGLASDEIQSVMSVMTERRIRHLPIVEGTRLVGIVSIGDLVNALRTDVEAENRHLRQYIAGTG